MQQLVKKLLLWAPGHGLEIDSSAFIWLRLFSIEDFFKPTFIWQH